MIEIRTLSEFLAMQADQDYILMADIDCLNSDKNKLGSLTYNGVFDLNGHSIKGIRTADSSLFYSITGTIKNGSISGMTGGYNNSFRRGLVCDIFSGRAENLIIDATVLSTSRGHVGGFCGGANAGSAFYKIDIKSRITATGSGALLFGYAGGAVTVDNCFISGTAQVCEYAGGVFAYTSWGYDDVVVVKNCSIDAELYASGVCAGISPVTNGISVIDCAVSGTMKSKTAYGVCHSIKDTDVIANCCVYKFSASRTSDPYNNGMFYVSNKTTDSCYVENPNSTYHVGGVAKNTSDFLNNSLQASLPNWSFYNGEYPLPKALVTANVTFVGEDTVTKTVERHIKLDKFNAEGLASLNGYKDGNKTYALGDIYPTEVIRRDKTVQAVYVGHKTQVRFDGVDAVGYYFNYQKSGLYFGDKITKFPVVSKSGYIFNGWYYNDTKIDENYTWNTIIGSVTLVPKWTEIQCVLHWYSIGNDYTQTTVDYGSEITPPTDPTREGYTFVGWQDNNGAMLKSGDVARGSASYYAKWLINKNITYNPNGGLLTINGVESQWCSFNDSPYYCAIDPTRDSHKFTRYGYTFVEWCIFPNGIGDGYAVGDKITLSGDTTNLYAIWKPEKKKLFFDTGEEVLVVWRKFESKIGVLPQPKKDGYVFEGWYLDGQKITSNYVVGETVTFTANWVASQYNIEWDLSYGNTTREQQNAEMLMNRALSRIVPQNIKLNVDFDEEPVDSFLRIDKSEKNPYSVLSSSSEFYEAQRAVTANGDIFDDFAWWMEKGVRKIAPKITGHLCQTDVFYMNSLVSNVTSTTNHFGVYSDKQAKFSSILTDALSDPSNALSKTKKASFVSSYYSDGMYADGIYPVSYATNKSFTNNIWWSSEENSENEEWVASFDNPSGVPLNHIEFNMTAKPMSVSFYYYDSGWKAITKNGSGLSLDYPLSGSGISRYVSVSFDNVYSSAIKLVFEKKEQTSVEMSNMSFSFNVTAKSDLDFLSGKSFIDFMGNTVDVEPYIYSASSILDGGYWLSKPNKSRDCVEYLVLDMGKKKAVTSIDIAPVYCGVKCVMYYSDDAKNWTPIMGSYSLDGEMINFNRIYCRYIKLEFSNLTALPFTENYPMIRKFIKYPQSLIANAKRNVNNSGSDTELSYTYPLDKTENELARINAGYFVSDNMSYNIITDDYYTSGNLDGMAQSQEPKTEISDNTLVEKTYDVKFVEGEHNYRISEDIIDGSIAYFVAIKSIKVYNKSTLATVEKDKVFSIGGGDIIE